MREGIAQHSRQWTSTLNEADLTKKKFLFDIEENSKGYVKDILRKMLPLVSPGYSLLTDTLLRADDHNQPNTYNKFRFILAML
jgi:hypothetical protein